MFYLSTTYTLNIFVSLSNQKIDDNIYPAPVEKRGRILKNVQNIVLQVSRERFAFTRKTPQLYTFVFTPI